MTSRKRRRPLGWSGGNGSKAPDAVIVTRSLSASIFLLLAPRQSMRKLSVNSIVRYLQPATGFPPCVLAKFFRVVPLCKFLFQLAQHITARSSVIRHVRVLFGRPSPEHRITTDARLSAKAAVLAIATDSSLENMLRIAEENGRRTTGATTGGSADYRPSSEGRAGSASILKPVHFVPEFLT